MGSFSNLIDVSSFFIGILINLLLVAMICYYFKRKIDNLEISQSEQAKMMYTILQRQEQNNMPENDQNDMKDDSRKNLMVDLGTTSHSYLQNLDLDSLNGNMNEIVEENYENEQELGMDSESQEGDNDSETDTESETDSDNDSNSGNEEVEHTQEMPEIKKIEIEPESIDKTTEMKPYEKMTVKELKQLIEEKGIALTRKNLKKNEYIDILLNNSVEEESLGSDLENDIENEVDLEDQDTEKADHVNEELKIVESEPEQIDANTMTFDEVDAESVIESMQSKVNAAIFDRERLNPRTFNLDLDLNATSIVSVEDM